MHDSSSNASFGQWLNKHRKALDLTQFDLAERVGCSEDTIQKIERGERRPSKQVAQRLAESLRIPRLHHISLPEEDKRLHLSARACHRMLKLVTRIADLAGSERMEAAHLVEAVQYRPRQAL